MKKTQKIKDRLHDHLDMIDKLNSIKLEKECLYGTLRSPNFSGMPGGGDKRTSEEERIYLRIQDLEKKAEKKQAEIDRDWAELEPLVEQLSPIETLIMNLRYRYGGEWPDVCFSIFGKRSDYEIEIDSYQNKMFKAHGRALCALADMMERAHASMEREPITH